MSNFAWIAFLAMFVAAPAAAQTAIPDLRGTWKGESESIILGAGNPHHAATPSDQPRLNKVAFTLTIDKQDGRRFSGTFSSSRRNDKFVAVISPNNTILLVDDDGYTLGTTSGPIRMERGNMHFSHDTPTSSCTQITHPPNHAAARRRRARTPALPPFVAQAIDIVDLVGEVTEIARFAVVLAVPIVGEFHQWGVAAGPLALLHAPFVLRGGQKDERVAVFVVD